MSSAATAALVALPVVFVAVMLGLAYASASGRWDAWSRRWRAFLERHPRLAGVLRPEPDELADRWYALDEVARRRIARAVVRGRRVDDRDDPAVARYLAGQYRRTAMLWGGVTLLQGSAHSAAWIGGSDPGSVVRVGVLVLMALCLVSVALLVQASRALRANADVGDAGSARQR